MRIAFGINSVGLGHATRSIPVIRELVARGHDVHVLSSGRPLAFLKDALGSSVRFTELRDYSFSATTYTERGASATRFVLAFPVHASEVIAEHQRFLRWLRANPSDVIVSDTRFGIYHQRIPSYLIFHHFRLDANIPGSAQATERVSSLVRQAFNHIFVPDFESPSLSGALSHELRYVPRKQVSYVGHLSMASRMDLDRDVPVFVSVSGPEPQRTAFEERILSGISSLPRGSVITFGKPDDDSDRVIEGVRVVGHLGAADQTRMLNRAQLVLTRSGYTTIMDLIETGTKGFFVPTKGQPEQEYLASFHVRKGNYYATSLEDLDLERQLPIAAAFPGFDPPHRVEESVRRIVEVLESPSSNRPADSERSGNRDEHARDR